MNLNIERERLVAVLQRVVGVVDKRQTLPILGHVLLRCSGEQLELVATDLEMELSASCLLTHPQAPGEATAPARKLLEICRQLPEGAEVRIQAEDNSIKIQAGKSRFTLPTLPASGFPAFDPPTVEERIAIDATALRVALDKTQFAMAQQDVRFYLNGMLWEVEGLTFRAVASDGHRLSLREVALDRPSGGVGRQAILPRKGVMELSRLLGDETGVVEIAFGHNGIRAHLANAVLSIKLVDSKYPDYRRVIPSDIGRHIHMEKTAFSTTLGRVMVLCQEKYRGVRFDFSRERVALSSGSEGEQAEDQVDASYDGADFTVAYNGAYLAEVAARLDGATLDFAVADATQACVLREDSAEGPESSSVYVIMPLRL